MESKQICHLKIIDAMKGVCTVWVIMMHAIPTGEDAYKFLLMPFYAQLTIPFFMTISGFTYTLSYEKSKKWYSFSGLWRKGKRFLLPYVPALLLEVLILGWPENTLTWLLSGGYKMPGSYYVILMLQLLLLFPVIYWCYKWLERCSWLTGLAIVFAFQCVYEAFTYFIDLKVEIYRLLIFRYVIFLYMGVVLYQNYKNKNDNCRSLMKAMPIGFIYIFSVGYLNWQPSVLFRYPTWYRSAAPVCFWVVPILAVIFANGNSILEGVEKYPFLRRISNVVQLLGKASYHVYIVQMLWFGIVVSGINTSSWRQLVFCMASLVVCLLLGIEYYYIFQRKVSLSKQNKMQK